jgi:hypothetical protein
MGIEEKTFGGRSLVLPQLEGETLEGFGCQEMICD